MVSLKDCLTELCASLNRACEIFDSADIYESHHHEEWTVVFKLREELVFKLSGPVKRYIRAFCRSKGWQIESLKTPRDLSIRLVLTLVDPKPSRAEKESPPRTQTSR